MKFEQLLEKVGSFHRFQKQLYVLLFLGAIPSAIITLHFGINHHVPKFRCSLPEKVELALQNTTSYDNLLEIFIPVEDNKFAQCKMYHFDEEELLNLTYLDSSPPTERNTTICTTGYHYYLALGQMSVISEFDLVCGDSWKGPLAVSIFFLGMGFGTFSGSFADRFGRRPVYLGASFFLVLTSALAGFSWNFISYVVIMFFCGYFSLFNYIVGFVLGAELTGVKRRNFMVLGSFYAFASGYLFLALFGYFFQNWRTFFFAVTICGLVYIPFYWLLPESVRWLMMKGRHSEAMKSLEKIAKINKKEIEDDRLLKKENDDDKISTENTDNTSYSILTPILSEIKGRCLTAYFCWFAISTVYFAISINSASFSPNRFLNILCGGLAELPSLMFGYFLITWIGRPRAVFLLMLVCGISCILVPYLPKEPVYIVTSVAIVGKGAVSAVFYITYVITAEVTPTLLRSTSMGIASACARLGGILAPFLMYMGNAYNAIPYIILGLLSILSGVATVMFIPETASVVMPDSVLDAANNTRFYRWKLCKKLTPTHAVVLPPTTNDNCV